MSSEKSIFDKVEGFLTPDAEDDQGVSQTTSAVAGIFSGLIKIPKGPVSLTAEIMDAGGGMLLGVPSTKDSDISAVAQVEEFFDKINPFEEVAQEKAAGKIAEALMQIGTFGTLGSKAVLGIANKIASKGLKAKKAGKLVNPKSKNLQKGLKKTKELNKLSGKQKFGAIVVGGALGETMVADNEEIGTFGDLFEGGPTELNREVEADPRSDATRRILNRLKFGGESLLLSPLVYGAGASIKTLATRGKQLAYSNKKIERYLDKVAGLFRPRGKQPTEVFLTRRTEAGRLMADTNFAMEQVKRIDKEVNKMFPTVKNFMNKTADDERGVFLKELNDLLFSGDLKKGIPEKDLNMFLKSAKKKGADSKSINNMVTSVNKVRKEFDRLLEITAQTPSGIVPLKKLQVDLRNLMGDRIKQYIGTTYKIFQNGPYSFYSRYKPTDQAVNKVKEIFLLIFQRAFTLTIINIMKCWM